MRLGVQKVLPNEMEAIEQRAHSQGWQIYHLHGSQIRDRETFFEAIRAGFPLNPPLMSNRSWDALSDSLWQGLFELPAHRIIISWSNSDVMAASPDDFETAISVFQDIVDSLADPEMTMGSTKEVTVLLS